ncbi:MAG: NUDIX domain-containing protein [bacterium]|nr:NUDIX domain-containing protein [bacterium]
MPHKKANFHNTAHALHATQRICVAVDNCIFTVQGNKLLVLLIQMRKKPFEDMWALPGGLIRNSENLDDAALRILKEETTLSNVYLEQLYTFGKPRRDPFGRVTSTAYLALIPSRDVTLRTIPKYADVRWWDFSRLPRLAYDHDQIVAYAKKRLVWKLEYTNIAWSLLPKKFTLTELQRVYEAILGKKLDKRNFRKKILIIGLVKSVGAYAVRGAYRPAMLYRFISRKPKILEIL